MTLRKGIKISYQTPNYCLSESNQNFRKSTSRSEGKQMCNYFQFEERTNSHYYAFMFPHKTDKKRTFY